MTSHNELYLSEMAKKVMMDENLDGCLFSREFAAHFHSLYRHTIEKLGRESLAFDAVHKYVLI